MKSNNYGRIVNMSSILGSLTDIAGPDSPHAEVQAPAYRLSKTLLNGITVLLAAAMRGTNILVNSVCLGWVRTDIGGNQAPASRISSFRVLSSRLSSISTRVARPRRSMRNGTYFIPSAKSPPGRPPARRAYSSQRG